VDLIQQTTSAQGQPVYKLTVFDRASVATRPTVVAYQLLDAKGSLICSAQVNDTYPPDKNTGAVVPRAVTLSWPAQKMEMKLRLDGVRINGLPAGQQLTVFTRPQMRNVREIDLAHLPAQPTAQVQRVRGSMR
jgi:hypothetical protein